MDRKQFLQNSLIIGGATILPSNSLAPEEEENGKPVSRIIVYDTIQ